MKIALTADWHFRGKDLEAAVHQGLALVHAAQERDCKVLGIAGDQFDRSSIGDNQASTGGIAAGLLMVLGEARAANMDVICIVGNHDQAGAGSLDAMHILDGRLGIHVARDAQSSCIEKDNVRFCCLPWQWSGDINSDWQTVCEQARGWNDQTVLLAHAQVIGAAYGAGGRACEPNDGKWQITRQMLEESPFDYIALGDFHKRQDLSGGRGGYVGALRQLNFGEEGNPAGFEVWDSETNETGWVELDAAPRYRTVTLQSGEKAPNPDPNERLRVQWIGDVDYAEVRALEAKGVDVEQILEREERVQRAEVPEGVVDRPHDLIRLYAENQEPPITGERLEQMLAVFDRVGKVAEVVPEAKPAQETAGAPF